MENIKSHKDTDRIYFFAFIIFITLIGFSVYFNVLNGDFILDDYSSIVLNEDIKNNEKDLSSYLGQSRSIGKISLAINYRLHGLDPFGYHLVNVIVHIINSVLVYLLINLLFQTPTTKSEFIAKYRRRIGFFTATIFAVHPIQTQAVSYITQRFESLSATFFLAALIFFLIFRINSAYAKGKSRKVIYAVLCTFFSLFAIFTKESTITIIPVLLLTELLLFPYSLKKVRIVGISFLSIILLFVGFLYQPSALSTIFSTSSGNDLSELVDSLTRETDLISRYDYAMTQINVTRTYMRLLVIPVNQILDYDYPVYNSFFNIPTVFSFLLILSVLLFSVRMLVRTRLVLFGLLFFGINLIPTSTIFPIQDVIFEHRLYLSSMGFILGAVVCYVLAANYLSGAKATKRLERHFTSLHDILIKIPYKDIILFFIIANTLMFFTYKRNFTWASEETMWEDVVRKAPNNWRGHANLSEVYRKKGLYEKQAQALQNVVNLHGHMEDSKYYQYNLASYYFLKQDFENAELYFNNAINLDPSFGEAHYYMGTMYMTKGDLLKALNELEIALKSKFYFQMPMSNIWYQLGLVHYLVLKNNELVQDNETKSILLEHKTDALKYFNLVLAEDAVFIDKSRTTQYVQEINEKW